MLTAVDLFAGCGGSSTGAKQAGVKVLYAANHWQDAVKIHSVNHPEVTHSCQDLQQADWRDFPDHDILLASPACIGHSKCRGKERPHHDNSRSTAWAVVDCVEVKQPKYIMVENVPEFLNWKHYHRWFGCLSEDYHLSENIIDAADLAVPQNRVRLFVVGIHRSVSDYPINIIKPRLPHRPASSIIDWEAKEWTLIDGHCENTIARINNGRKQFGKKPFFLAYYGATTGGRSIERPLGTVTTHDRFALIHGRYMRMLTPKEYSQAMGFSADYILPKQRTRAVKMIGNACVPAVVSYIMRQIKKRAA